MRAVEKTFSKHKSALMELPPAYVIFERRSDTEIMMEFENCLKWPWTQFDAMFQDVDSSHNSSLEGPKLDVFLRRIGWDKKHYTNILTDAFVDHGKTTSLTRSTLPKWLLWKLAEECRETKHILVLGECGDGKSTLVNGIKSSQAVEAQTGQAARGVTKTLDEYEGTAKGEDGFEKRFNICDTPGIGDADIGPAEVCRLVEEKYTKKRTGAVTRIDGIVMTYDFGGKGRFTMAAKLAGLLIQGGFLSDNASAGWKSVVVALTKCDLIPVTATSETDLKETEAFLRAKLGEEITIVQTHNREGGYNALKKAILQMPSVKLEYTPIDNNLLAGMIAKACNLPVDQVDSIIRNIDKWREELQEKLELESSLQETEKTIEEKESLLQGQEKTIEGKESLLKEKESLLQGQEKRLKAKRPC